MVHKLKKSGFILIFLIILLNFIYSEEQIHLIALYEAKHFYQLPIVLHETEEKVYFQYNGVTVINKNNFEYSREYKEFDRFIYSMDEIVIRDQSSNTNRRTFYDINLSTGSVKLSDKIKVLDSKLSRGYTVFFQRDIFFYGKIFDGDLTYLTYELFKKNLKNDEEEKILPKKTGFGPLIFSPDKSHLLIDAENTGILYNTALKTSKEVFQNVYIKNNAVFFNSYLIMAVESLKNTWRLENLLTGDHDKLQFIVNGSSIHQIVFFNHGRNAIAKGRKTYIVDARPLRDWLIKRKIVPSTKKGILKKNAKVYKNGNFEAPVLSTMAQNTETIIWDKGGVQIERRGLKNYFYQIVLPDKRYGWILGEDLIFGDVLDKKSTDTALNAFILRLNKNEKETNQYNILLSKIIQRVSFIS
jgi:hypothetical protein